MRRVSPGGTEQPSPAACSSRPRPSRQGSSPARTRMRTSTTPSSNSTGRWSRLWIVSLLLPAAVACPGPRVPPAVPGAEPELRVGLAVGASSVTLGGGGELCVADEATGQPISSMREGQGCDDWGDMRDEVYTGVAGETPDVWEEVRRTTGQALTYNGEIIDAYFHSTCGSSTAGVEEVFETAKARPYLRPVSDASGG